MTHGSTRPHSGAGRLWAVTLALLFGCDDDPGGPPGDDLGDLRVTTTTTGFNLDPDGYTLLLDPGTDHAVERTIGRDGTVTFPELDPGQHSLTLGGLQFGCTITSSDPALVDNTTLLVEVVAGDTTDVLLGITCAPLPDGRLAFMAECFAPTPTATRAIPTSTP